MLTSRQRFQRVMRYEEFDRAMLPGVWPFSPWPETEERWKREGYGQPGAPTFPFDKVEWQAEWFFPTPPFEREVLEEDENTVVYVNEEGIVIRELKKWRWSSMPQFIRFPSGDARGVPQVLEGEDAA